MTKEQPLVAQPPYYLAWSQPPQLQLAQLILQLYQMLSAIATNNDTAKDVSKGLLDIVETFLITVWDRFKSERLLLKTSAGLPT